MEKLKVFKQHPSAVVPAFATQGSACFDLCAAFDVESKIKVIGKGVFVPDPNLLGMMGDFMVHEGTITPLGTIQDDGSYKAQLKIPDGCRVLIPTGLIFDIPDNHVLKVYSRSGTSLKKGLILTNSVGIIDSDYVEEVFISMTNISGMTIDIAPGERIAQAMLEKVIRTELVELETRPSRKTTRQGGFGSTGTK